MEMGCFSILYFHSTCTWYILGSFLVECFGRAVGVPSLDFAYTVFLGS
jgi:hypothetical protein